MAHDASGHGPWYRQTESRTVNKNALGKPHQLIQLQRPTSRARRASDRLASHLLEAVHLLGIRDAPSAALQLLNGAASVPEAGLVSPNGVSRSHGMLWCNCA